MNAFSIFNGTERVGVIADCGSAPYAAFDKRGVHLGTFTKLNAAARAVVLAGNEQGVGGGHFFQRLAPRTAGVSNCANPGPRSTTPGPTQ